MGLFSRLRWRKESGGSGVPSDEAGESAVAATESESVDRTEAGESSGDAPEAGEVPESGKVLSGDGEEAGAPAAETSGPGRAAEHDGTASAAGSPGIPRQQSAAAAADSEADDRA